MAATMVPSCRFWKEPTTWIVSFLRLGVIFFPLIQPKSILHSWLDAASLIFQSNSYTLQPVYEALAIQQLSSGNVAGAYVAGPSYPLPPLCLMPLSYFVQLFMNHPWIAKLCVACLACLVDFLVAHALESIGILALYSDRIEAVSKEGKQQENIHPLIRPPPMPECLSSPNLPLWIAQFYYFCPATILSSCYYACFQNVPALLFLVSWVCLVRRPRLAAWFMGATTYLHTPTLAMWIPFVLARRHIYLLRQSASASNATGDSSQKKAHPIPPHISTLLALIGWWSLLWLMSAQWMGTTEILAWKSPIHGWMLPGLAPSLSVQWYLQIQLFSRFQPYFQTLLRALPYLLVVPLSWRLHAYPLVLVTIFHGIWTIFRPVQTLFDTTLLFCFALWNPRSLVRMPVWTILVLTSLGVPVLLAVLDQWMWIGPNTGNPNYTYFQCLAFNALEGILVAQFASASLQRDKALRIKAEVADEAIGGEVSGSSASTPNR